MTVSAVVFDLDGVLVDTERLWTDAKHALVVEAGGRWRVDAEAAMFGMSGPEWAAYIRDDLAVALPAEEIRGRVVAGVLQRLRERVPEIPGARQAVIAVAERWPVGLASSADRPVIDAILSTLDLADVFRASLASDEAGRGKPAPDVYLAVAERLGVRPEATVAIEDSPNGMRSARAAGMGLIAIPHPVTDGRAVALELADVVLDSISELTPDAVERVALH